MTAPTTGRFKLAGLDWQIDPLDCDAQFEVECILIKILAPSAAAGVASLVQGLAPAVVEVLREAALGGGERITEFDDEAMARDARRSKLVDRGEGVDQARWAIIHPNGQVIAEDTQEGDLRESLRELENSRIERRGDRWLVLTTGHEDKFDIANVIKLDTGDPRLLAAWDRLLDALAETGGEVIREVIFMVAQVLEHTALMRLFSLAVFANKCLVSDPMGERASQTPKDLAGANAWKTLSSYLQRDPRAKYELLGKALLVTYGRAEDGDDEDGDGGGDE